MGNKHTNLLQIGPLTHDLFEAAWSDPSAGHRPLPLCIQPQTWHTQVANADLTLGTGYRCRALQDTG